MLSLCYKKMVQAICVLTSLLILQYLIITCVHCVSFSQYEEIMHNEHEMMIHISVFRQQFGINFISNRNSAAN